MWADEVQREMDVVPGWKAQFSEAIRIYDMRAGPYDEVFHEVGRRLRQNRYATRSDIAIIGCWKRSVQGSWIGRLLATPDPRVREATGEAFRASSDLAALRALSVLPGFKSKGPIATALLCAYDPARFGVMDRRAWLGLERLGASPGRGRGETVRYLTRVRELRDDMRSSEPSVTARDIDKGLFILGKP